MSNENNRTAIRHGDLCLIPVDSIPEKAMATDCNVLAYGEATGHNHVLTVEKTNEPINYFTLGAEKFINVKERGLLAHPEHKTLPVERGLYKVSKEQEYDPFSKKIREVAD